MPAETMYERLSNPICSTQLTEVLRIVSDILKQDRHDRSLGVDEVTEALHCIRRSLELIGATAAAVKVRVTPALWPARAVCVHAYIMRTPHEI